MYEFTKKHKIILINPVFKWDAYTNKVKIFDKFPIE